MRHLLYITSDILNELYKYSKSIKNVDNFKKSENQLEYLLNLIHLFLNDKSYYQLIECKNILFTYIITIMGTSKIISDIDNYLSKFLIDNILSKFDNYMLSDLINIFDIFIRKLPKIKTWFIQNLKLSYGLEFLCWGTNHSKTLNLSENIIEMNTKRQSLIGYLKFIL